MRCLVGVLLAAWVLTAQTDKSEAKASISGVVRDTNGAPVAGVTVSAHLGAESRVLNMANGQVVRVGIAGVTAFTDLAGSYSIAGLPAGTYSVRTDRDPVSKGVTVKAGQDATLDLVIPANPSISGKVVDQDDNPAVDAFVWLLKSAYQEGVLKQVVIGPKVTGEDGSYSFDTKLEVNRRYYVLVDRPPPEEIVLAVAADLVERAPIEVPTYYPSATQMDSAAPIILQAGENREGVNVKIASAPFYCVEGKIQVGGKPVAANFAVQEAPLAGTRLARIRGYGDSDGKYQACGLSPGEYKLSTNEGFAEFAISRSDVGHVDLLLDTATPRVQVDWEGESVKAELPKLNDKAEETLQRIAGSLGMKQPLSDGDRRMLATRLVHGELSGEERAEMQKAVRDNPSQLGNLVTSLLPLSNPVTVIVTGLGNNFMGPLRGSVPSGDYIIDVHAPEDCYVKEITYNNLKINESLLRIGPAESGTVRVLMAKGTSQLTVAAVDTEGKPVADATLIAVPESVTTVRALNRLPTHGKTDQDGNYTPNSLAPGKYRVLATTQPVRWDVPEDLEKVLLVLFQAKEIELDGKGAVRTSVEPVPIY